MQRQDKAGNMGLFEQQKAGWGGQSKGQVVGRAELVLGSEDGVEGGIALFPVL